MAPVTRAAWSWRAVLWTLLLAAGMPVDVGAQANPPQPVQVEQGLLRVIEISVRPGALAEWAKLQHDELIPAQRAGGLPWVDVWRTAGAGDPYFRSIVVPLASLQDLDGLSPFEKALGPKKAAALLERHRNLITAVRTRIVRPRPDLGFGTRATVPNVGVLSTVTVVEARAQEFEQRLQSSVVREVRDANVANLSVGQILYGGEGRQYFVLMYYENFKALAGGHGDPLDSVQRSDGVSRLANEPNSPIIRIDRTILQYDSRLSSGTRGGN
jgi:hypothetical protein